MSLWHILISESVSVYCWDVVGLLQFEFGNVSLLSVTIPALCYWSVCSWCHVGYLSVSNWITPYQIVPEMNPNMNLSGSTVFSAIVSLADNCPIQWKFASFVGLAPSQSWKISKSCEMCKNWPSMAIFNSFLLHVTAHHHTQSQADI